MGFVEAIVRIVVGGVAILLGIGKSKQSKSEDDQNFKSIVPDDKKAPLIDRKKEIEEKVENINKAAAELKQQQENAAKIAQNAIAQSKALKKKKMSSSAKSTPIENPAQPTPEPLKSTTAQLAASATVDTPASVISSSFNFPSNGATESLQDALFNNLKPELGESWQSDFIRSADSPYILKKDTEEIQITKDKIDIKSSNEETFLIILRTLHKTDNTVIPEISSPAKDVATWESAFTKFKAEFPNVDISKWTINGETPKAIKEVSLQDNAANDFADEKTSQSQNENQINPYSENDVDQQQSQKHGM